MSTKLVNPFTVEDLDRRSEHFARLIERRMRSVVRQTMPFLDQTTTASVRPSELRRMSHSVLLAAVSPDDVNPIKNRWTQIVDDELLDLLGDQYFAGVAATGTVLSNAGFGAPLFDESLASQQFLEQARNRLVGIGNELWSDARSELTAGMRLGESVPQLADRVQQSVDVAMPRATTIARTEVIGASNAGSITTMRESGLVTKKEWISTLDDRTREDHVLAQGQIVDLGDRFEMDDGSTLDHPGDPAGPPEQIINCRCAMGYEVGEPDEPDPVVTPDTIASGEDLTAAAKEFHEGCMIALVPKDKDARRIALDDGSPVNELHITIAFLGDIEKDVDDKAAEEARAIVKDIAGRAAFDYVPSTVAGVGTLGSEDPPAAVLFLNGEVLDIIHDEVLSRMDDSEVEFRAQFRPWIPHLTLGYGNDPSEIKLAGEEIEFDRIRLCLGDEVADYELRDTIR